MRSARTTAVSTPRTGRPSARPATDCAFPRACSPTIWNGSAPAGISSSYAGATTSKVMCSCSRIALRCGDVDASRSGDDGGASATLACDPDLVCRPLACPFGRYVLVVRMRLGIRRRIELDEPVDLESTFAQKVDPVAVSEVELDLVCVRPFVLAQLELGPDELF